jgi:hypothetical protein
VLADPGLTIAPEWMFIRHKLPLPLNEFGQIGASLYIRAEPYSDFIPVAYRQMHRC